MNVSPAAPYETWETAAKTIFVPEVNHFVNFASAAPQFPYTNWQTAARTIQEAVDASNVPDRIVWVTNGIYNVGSKGSFETEGQNRVVLTNQVHLRSVNGPEWTLIRGERTADVAIRGVYLGEGSVLEGFTIEDGSAGGYPESGVRCKGNGQILNCIIRNSFGAGANGGRYYNCWFTGNSGEGVVDAALYNCTVTHNRGIGVRGCQVFNSIVYYNTGGNAWNHDQASSTFAYSCTTPLALGLGNISSSPKLASFRRLGPESPCIGAGDSTYSVGEDLDGQAWLNPPCMGADQLIGIPHEGDVQLGIVADGTNVGVGFPLRLSANIDGDVQSSVWDFGDGVRITNNPALTHAWSSPGVYPVRLIGYNATFPQGIETTTNITVVSEKFYVNPRNLSPLTPYGSWETAATNIQDAIDAGTTPGRVIVVTNGTYATGQSSVSVAGENQVNRIAITNGAVLKSVNGPGVTVIDGTGVRCVYLGGGAQISGFTLTKGSSIWGGVGVLSDGFGIVTNCIITNNICASNGRFGGAGALNTVIYNSWLLRNSSLPLSPDIGGGGAMGSELNNCIVSGNKALVGGGVAECLLRNCTVTKNQVPAFGTTFAIPTGGGAYKSTLDNCIVEFNTIFSFSDRSTSNHVSCLINYSCTGPLPTNGHGNFSADPRFVSAANDNFRLAPDSPCINSGLNSLAPTSTDLAGSPRIIGGVVDVGAYEYLTPKSILSYAWLQQYGLPIDGSADFKDSDADGVSNLVEWKAGTNPKDSQSKLKLLPLTLGNSGALVSWKSVSERNYTLQRAHELSSTPTFETISPTLPGQTNVTSYLDPTPIGNGPFFYRVKVLANE